MCWNCIKERGREMDSHGKESVWANERTNENAATRIRKLKWNVEMLVCEFEERHRAQKRRKKEDERKTMHLQQIPSLSLSLSLSVVALIAIIRICCLYCVYSLCVCVSVSYWHVLFSFNPFRCQRFNSLEHDKMNCVCCVLWCDVLLNCEHRKDLNEIRTSKRMNERAHVKAEPDSASDRPTDRRTEWTSNKTMIVAKSSNSTQPNPPTDCRTKLLLLGCPPHSRLYLCVSILFNVIHNNLTMLPLLFWIETTMRWQNGNIVFDDGTCFFAENCIADNFTCFYSLPSASSTMLTMLFAHFPLLSTSLLIMTDRLVRYAVKEENNAMCVCGCVFVKNRDYWVWV